MLKTRILTSIVGLSVLLSAILWGKPWVVALIIAIIVGVCIYELTSLCFARFINSDKTTGSTYFDKILIITAGVVTLVVTIKQSYTIVPVLFFMIILLSFFVLKAKSIDTLIVKSLVVLLALFYIVLPWCCIYNLFELGGSKLIIFLLAVAWGGDTGAYFAGSYLGKHKLSPLISPSKTIEGSVGGILSSVLLGFLITAIFDFNEFSTWSILTSCVFGAVFGQIGDLFESSIKRFCKAKDSGQILPGHGGMLDRVDALMFTGSIVWIIFKLFGNI